MGPALPEARPHPGLDRGREATLPWLTGKREFGRLHGEIQELLADLWQIPRVAGLHHGFRPPTDCFRTEDPPELIVVVDLAGIDPSGVDVVVAGRDLFVTGDRARPPAAKRPSYRQMEIDYGRFERHVPLGEEVDVEKAQATYDNGFLTIVLPVASQVRSKDRTPIEVTTRE
jgi:HSP20 family protein